MWSVKIGSRYVAVFLGDSAKKRAIDFAATKFAKFLVVDKPMPRRERPRTDAIVTLRT